jgi:GDP-L-fucose synthase
MCWAYNRQYNTHFIPVMPTNLYGPNDNFDYETSHVLPALIRKFHEAKKKNLDSVIVWGTGTPKREFLHVDDLARACVFLMETDAAATLDLKKPLINIGTGKDLSISELALLVKQVLGFKGDIIYDRSKPDGTPQKLLDVSVLTSLGWTSQVSLKEGIHTTYKWFLKNF